MDPEDRTPETEEAGDETKRISVAHRRELRSYLGASGRKHGRFDVPMFLLTVILLTFGVVMVLSASYVRAYYSSEGSATNYFVRQLIFAVLGVFLMVFVSYIKIDVFRRLSLPLLGVSVAMLALVPIIGETENGATRWINLGFTTFQPSEITKLALIMAYAVLICNYRNRMKTFKYGVLPFAIVAAVVVGLLVLEPHYSASIIVIAITLFMMFMGGTRTVYFVAGFLLVAAAGFLVYKTVDYVAVRIDTWRHPFDYPQGDGWQTIQSLYAVGSGGFLGLGLGQSRQKFLWLPEEHNDFIFSVVCEELGFLGAALILILFAMLIIRGFWIAVHAKDRYSALVAAGISGLLAIQVILNVAVVTNLVPCTGISLPFFSYGGTALLIQLFEIGIVLSVSREVETDAPAVDPGDREEPADRDGKEAES